MIDLNLLVARAKAQAAAPKAPKVQSPARQILDDILRWRNTKVIFQELHQHCSCCQGEWVSINGIMIERQHEISGARKTALARSDISHDQIAGLPREKLVIEQSVPFCPDCFQFQELLDLVRRPQNVGLPCGQKDLFL